MSDYSQFQRARSVLETKVRQGIVKRESAHHLTEDLLQFDEPIAARYKRLDVIRILQDNCRGQNAGLPGLIHGLAILERYGKNLLRSERPPLWRVVRLSNAVFKQEVDIIKGAREILKHLGYTHFIDDGMAFPEDLIIPDIPNVATVTADILLLRQELLMLANKEHKQERDFYPYVPRHEIEELQEDFQLRAMAKANKRAPVASVPAPQSLGPVSSGSAISNTNFMSSQYPMVDPPTYQDVVRGAGQDNSFEPMTIGSASHELSSIAQQMVSAQEPTTEAMPTSTEPLTSEIRDEDLCDLCGQKRATCRCQQCDQIFCEGCNKIYHSNPKRRNHQQAIVLLQQGGARMDVPEVVPTARNHAALNQMSMESRVSNSSMVNRHDPSQERGAPGCHSLQPTISGERLMPTLNSRPSTSDHDNEWTRNVNRMATDLMDISNPSAQKKKLMECLTELDREASKYNRAIDTLRKKPDKKTSLVTHFQERLTKIDDIKEQFKMLCGYEDSTPVPTPTPQSMEEPNFSNLPSVESWSFRSVPPQANTPPIASNFEMNAPQQIAPVLQTQPHHSQVTIANLIDLSSEMASSSTPQLQNSFSSTAQPAVVQPATRSGRGSTQRNYESGAPMSAAEDPELQSVFSPPPMHSGPASHGSLKRNLENGKNEVTQPAKIQRESQGSSAEIATEFENMNIETLPANLDLVQMQSRKPEDQDEDGSDSEEDFESAEEGMEDPSSLMLQDRLEEPLPKIMTPFLGISREALQDRIRKEDDRYQTTQFLDAVRAGDASSFRPEQVETALQELEKEGNSNRFTPNAWLERNWDGHVKSFIELVKERNLKISKENAEDVLLEAKYNFSAALKLILTVQHEQIADIADEFGLDKAKKAITQSKGDKYHALALLQKERLAEVYAAFNNDETENDDDILILKRTIAIEDDQIKHRALTSILDFNDVRRAETLDALYDKLLGRLDMLGVLLEDTVESVASDELVDAETALHYLNNECMICMEKFPRSKITCLPTCGESGCKYCRSCLEQHLTICVRDKHIRDIVCPVCSQPETNSDEETQANFFNHIDAILLQMNDRGIHEIFQHKVRDFTLMRLPNFRWCSHCSGGFQFDVVEGNLKMTCPFCRKCTCYNCKKPWEAQHDDATCDQFQQWKEQNDPEFQAAGLARHLRENGIDCPDCNFRYALAKGGCMHFKCTQCSHEFCSGCNSAFKHGRKCGKLQTCQLKGLHAHHPRDCLFFLRDLDPEMLKKLLRDNNVQYNIKGTNNKTCQVMEQKETPTGLKDDACGRPVVANCAGLCKLHYMEYLVNLVNTHGLDPADVLSIDELRPCLMREDIEVPPRKNRESDDAYKNRLLIEVKKLPLKREAQDVEMQGDRL